jgi:hypothetical protein
LIALCLWLAFTVSYDHFTSPMPKISWLRFTVISAAAAAALAPLPPRAVERWYSAWVYAGIQPLVTSISNLAPFALLDVLIVAATALWIALAAADLWRARAWSAAGRMLFRSIVWAATAYLAFLCLWGLNYRRPRLRELLPYDASAVTADAAVAAGRLAVERLNALHDPAHAAGWPAPGDVDADLAAGFATAARDAAIGHDVVPARPKATLLTWYFRRAGVDGMTDPFFLETLVSGGILPFERPFVVAHEWSHLAGIADEGEANFTATLACIRGAAPNAYSGWLFLYGELARAVNGPARAAMSGALADGPRGDLRAIRERYTRDVSPRISGAGWRVYDSYLKANRVEAGTASYDEVVRLVLGVRVAGRPVLPASRSPL